MMTIGPAGFNQAPAQRSRVGYLKEDRQEKVTAAGKGRFVRAWRVLNENGDDLFQPWCSSVAEAREVCAELGIELRPEPPCTF